MVKHPQALCRLALVSPLQGSRTHPPGTGAFGKTLRAASSAVEHRAVELRVGETHLAEVRDKEVGAGKGRVGEVRGAEVRALRFALRRVTRGLRETVDWPRP